MMKNQEKVKTSLTRRQLAILAHLQTCEETGTPAPTLDELCAQLGLHSRGSLHKHIQALTQAGAIEPMNHKQRGVRLATAPDSPDRGTMQILPVLGRIAAGRPIEAIVDQGNLELPSWLVSARPCYVLRVKGDSMIEAGIHDNDFVVIEQRSHANNGEIVVALIDQHEATLKHYHQRAGQIILSPANATLQPMVFDPDRIQVQGVLIAQMRRYS